MYGKGSVCVMAGPESVRARGVVCSRQLVYVESDASDFMIHGDSHFNRSTVDTSSARKVVVRLPGKGNSNSHDARPVHLIITMLEWNRTSRLSKKNSLSRAFWRGCTVSHDSSVARIPGPPGPTIRQHPSLGGVFQPGLPPGSRVCVSVGLTPLPRIQSS